jgi:hypothetical protein
MGDDFGIVLFCGLRVLLATCQADARDEQESAYRGDACHDADSDEHATDDGLGNDAGYAPGVPTDATDEPTDDALCRFDGATGALVSE